MHESEVNVSKIIFRSVLGLLALVIVLGTFVTVKTGEMGVKTRLGKVVSVMEPGLHGKVPFIEQVTKIEVRNRVVKNEHYTNAAGEVVSDNALTAASKDLQDVKVSTVLNYSIDQSKILELFTQYKTADRFEETVVKPTAKQVVKSVTAEYTAEELVTKRAEINEKVNTTLRDILSEHYAILEQSSITNIEFSPSFTQAIEKKVTAEQDALASKNKLEQTKYEGEQKIVSAKAEAEAIRIQSQAINSQGGTDYVNLKAIEQWDGHLPTQMIPGSSVPFINVNR